MTGSCTVRRWVNPPLIAFVASIVISLITVLIAPLPAPQFHDEFSYLLAGDTFARGRLTNPTHPLWEFFETFQVLAQPTYASKYPPGQGMFLAIGQVIAREPIVGVWLSTALACAAIAWMAQAALARRWSTLCGLLAATHPQVLDWNWSYWGGAVAMLGGALLLGATLRMRHRASWRDGVIAGIGIAILANSRPWEGALLTVLCLIWMVALSRKRKFVPVLSSLAIVLAINFAWMGYYNWRVTGRATTLPYSLYEKQYAPTRPLAWLSPPASQPVYRILAMREFYLNWELPNYQSQRSTGGFIQASLGKLWDFAKGFGRAPTLLLALIGLPSALRRWKWMRIGVVIIVVCMLNSLPVLTYFPHYSAPIVPLLLLLIATCGFAIPRARRAVLTIVLIGQSIALVNWIVDRARTDTTSWNYTRQAFIDQRTATNEKALVFVRVQPEFLKTHPYLVHVEYVYNSADIDGQAVVWARDLGPARNRELIDYYRAAGDQRELLLFDVGQAFVPYNESK